MRDELFEEIKKDMEEKQQLIRIEEDALVLNIGGRLNRLEAQKQLKEMKEEHLEQLVKALAEVSNKISALGMLAIKEGMERSVLLGAEVKGVH